MSNIVTDLNGRPPVVLNDAHRLICGRSNLHRPTVASSRDQMMSNRDDTLARLLTLVEGQAREIRAIKRKLDEVARAVRPKLKGAVVYPDCGYEWMDVYIELSPKTWAKVKSGRPVKVKGTGWVPEGYEKTVDSKDFFWDYWEFKGGIGKPLTVFMKSPHDPTMNEYAFDDVLREDSFEEIDSDEAG